MSEVAQDSAPAAASPVGEKKAKKAPSAKKPKTKPNHPPTSEMVDAAIAALKEKGGSSFLAMKKYIAATYKTDAEKLAPFIKKYLKTAVAKGHLIQPKGKGASGSFKLSVKGGGKKESKPKSDKPKAAKAKSAKPAKKASAEKKKPAKKAEKPKAAKKVAVEKKKVEKSKAVAAKKSATVKAKPAPKAKAAPKPKKPAAAKKATPAKAKKAGKKVSAKK